MINVLVIALCWGYAGPDDVTGHGSASRRTEGYAKQEAVVAAKDDGWRQCDERHKAYYNAEVVKNECRQLAADEWQCDAETCGNCVEREP